MLKEYFRALCSKENLYLGMVALGSVYVWLAISLYKLVCGKKAQSYPQFCDDVPDWILDVSMALSILIFSTPVLSALYLMLR